MYVTIRTKRLSIRPQDIKWRNEKNGSFKFVIISHQTSLDLYLSKAEFAMDVIVIHLMQSHYMFIQLSKLKTRYKLPFYSLIYSVNVEEKNNVKYLALDM